MTRADLNQFTLWSLWLIFYPERILNEGYQLLWVWTSQLQDRVWNRCALLVSNRYTICSPVQCHERRAKPQQCGSECQSCVNTAAVRPSAANLAPQSLQQYHPKYSTHTITSVSILTTGCIVNIRLVAAPGLWLLSLDFTLHCIARPFVVQTLLSTPIRKLFCKTVWSRGQKTDYLIIPHEGWNEGWWADTGWHALS